VRTIRREGPRVRASSRDPPASRGARGTWGFALAIEPGSNVPWWRVIRSSGEIALQGDPTRGPLQRARLIEEGVGFVDRKRQKVDMKAHQWRPKTRTVKKKKR
jgi:alkylated DNA nucleotide flippase Atl1